MSIFSIIRDELSYGWHYIYIYDKFLKTISKSQKKVLILAGRPGQKPK